jgi:hypothetical protein
VKTYYQFWLEGGMLAEDENLEHLMKFVQTNILDENWGALNMNDFQFIKCEQLEIKVNVTFTKGKK